MNSAWSHVPPCRLLQLCQMSRFDGGPARFPKLKAPRTRLCLSLGPFTLGQIAPRGTRAACRCPVCKGTTHVHSGVENDKGRMHCVHSQQRTQGPLADPATEAAGVIGHRPE